MSDEGYKVVLEGTLLHGHDRTRVVESLSKAFKQDPRVTERLLRGQARVIKKGLDHPTAQRYRDALQKMGAASHIEPEAPPGHHETTAEPSTEPAPVEATGTSDISCPRCGYKPVLENDVLLVRGDCPKCGLIVKGTDELSVEAFKKHGLPVDHTQEDMYDGVDVAPLQTRVLAGVYTFGLFLMVYIGFVIAFMILFFPVRDIPYHIVKNFLFTAYSNFPLLMTATSILLVAFLMPLVTEGRTWGQREFGIGILFSGEAETGGLILSLAFRVAAILCISYAPGLVSIRIGEMLGHAEFLEPYHTPVVVLGAIPAWVISWIFLLATRGKRSILDFVSGTIQTEEALPPPDAALKALKPLAIALGFVLLFGLVTPLFFL